MTPLRSLLTMLVAITLLLTFMLIAFVKEENDVREFELQSLQGQREELEEVVNEPDPYETIEATVYGYSMVTAYSEFDSCHTGESCLMASGEKAHIGAIACPRSIKMYTRVIIDNTPYICEDRTSIKYDGRFDIFMGYGEEANKEAKQFGIQRKQVQILQ